MAVAGCLFGEVGGGVFFLGADLLLGFDLEEAVEGAAVAAVGGEPEAAREGFAVVGEGQRDGGEGGVAMGAVGVVLGFVAEPDLHIGGAVAALVEAGEGAELGVHADRVSVRDGVADEVGFGLRLGFSFCVRGGRGAAERAHGAGEFGLERLHEDGVGPGDGGRGSGAGCSRVGGDRECEQGERENERPGETARDQGGGPPV